MKSEIYNALASLNRGFDVALEALKVLQQEQVLTAEYVQDQTVLAEELRAGLNHRTTEKLNAREAQDWGHFGKLRTAIEERMKS